MLNKNINPQNSIEASLHHISSDIVLPELYNTLVSYESKDIYDTEEEVNIDYGIKDGINYRIIEIEDGAFSNCTKLKNIYISQYVRKITWNMFRCLSLQNIYVDINNIHYKSIDGVLFSNEDCLRLIGFPACRKGLYIVPEGTIELGNCAFKSSQISEIILPDTLRIIGMNTFYECRNLKEIIVPDSIKIIKNNYNVGMKPITQTFYFKSDINKTRPYKINELCTMFPEK